MSTQPFGLVEVAVSQAIQSRVPSVSGRVGGDMAFTPGEDPWVMVSLIPGSTDRLFGTWVIEVDCFANTYREAMALALEIEAALVGPLIVTNEMVIDNCYQDQSPADRPWPDDDSYRVGAVYTMTARRR